MGFNNGVNLNTINTSIEELYMNMNTMFLARIESYDHISSTCSVQPLEKQKDYFGNSIDPSIILKVPVAIQKTKTFFMRFPYKENDIVLIGVSQNALDDLIITGQIEENTLSEQGRHFDVNDAIVLGGIFTEQETQMPDTNSNDLIIGNRDNGSKIVFSEDGTVNIENGTSITISPSGDVTVIAPTSMDYTSPTINLNADTGLNVTSPISTFNGNVQINGAITGGTGGVSMSVTGSGMSVTGGEISSDQDVKAGSVSLTNHTADTVITSGSSAGTWTSDSPN